MPDAGSGDAIPSGSASNARGCLDDIPCCSSCCSVRGAADIRRRCSREGGGGVPSPLAPGEPLPVSTAEVAEGRGPVVGPGVVLWLLPVKPIPPAAFAPRVDSRRAVALTTFRVGFTALVFVGVDVDEFCRIEV